MNRRRPWTEQEEVDLLKWHAEGKSFAIISVRLKRSVMAVQNRFYGLQKPPQQMEVPFKGECDGI